MVFIAARLNRHVCVSPGFLSTRALFCSVSTVAYFPSTLYIENKSSGPGHADFEGTRGLEERQEYTHVLSIAHATWLPSEDKGTCASAPDTRGVLRPQLFQAS